MSDSTYLSCVPRSPITTAVMQSSVLSTTRNPTDAASRLLMSCWVGILVSFVLDSTRLSHLYAPDKRTHTVACRALCSNGQAAARI